MAGYRSRIGFLSAGLLLAASLFPSPSAAEPVRVASVAPYEGLAHAWGLSASVPTEVQTFEIVQAIRQLAGEKYDYALVPAPLLPGHRAVLEATPRRRVRIVEVGWETVIPIVHPGNPIESLSEDLARRLVASEDRGNNPNLPRDWGALLNEPSMKGRAVEVVLPSEETPAGKALMTLVVRDCPIRAGGQRFTSDTALERAVAKNPLALGWVHRLRYIGQARVLPIVAEGKIEAATADPTTLASGNYPFARKILIVANGEPDATGQAGSYLRFVRSDAGQREVQRLGFIRMYPRAPSAQ